MAFQVRNLMISVLPAGLDMSVFECDAGSTSPPGGTPPPTGSGARRFDVRGFGGAQGDPSQENLEMRMLLQNALVRLGGPLSSDEMQPRSLADLDLLEGSLTDALEEVRALRARFT